MKRHSGGLLLAAPEQWPGAAEEEQVVTQCSQDTGVLALDWPLEVLPKHQSDNRVSRDIALALQAETVLKPQGGSGSAVSAALGQHQKDPGVKSSLSPCKRMGWCFRSGNSYEESDSWAAAHSVGASAQEWTGTGLPQNCG